MIKRLTSLAAALAALCAMIVLGPAAATASAAACAAPWSSSSVYTGGKTASYNGHNWTAKWWTQNETPGRSDVWADAGICGGGTDPGNPDPSGFVVSETQFNQMFPSRNSFYTYKGLTDALKAYPGFANTGSDTVKRQEAAAFLANVHHETGGLVRHRGGPRRTRPHRTAGPRPASRAPRGAGLARPGPSPRRLPARRNRARHLYLAGAHRVRGDPCPRRRPHRATRGPHPGAARRLPRPHRALGRRSVPRRLERGAQGELPQHRLLVRPPR
ncbi:hypothetical protein SALBM135S_08625 [Streptomyces alboniger]